MTLPHRIRQQDGFTFLEVLIICVIVGILAATTYSVFLGRDQSAQDAEAKSNARSLLWKVHTCFTATEDYTLCDEPSEQEPPPGVRWGSAPGEVEVVRGPKTSRYRVTVRALSRATSDGKHHTFTIVKDANGGEKRTCETDKKDDAGGCTKGDW
jgi:Tfp pilus assembly protein PilE